MKNIINWLKKHPIITTVFIVFFFIIIGASSSDKNIKNKKEVNKLKKVETTASLKQKPTTTITKPPTTVKTPTKQILQKRDENFLSHNELLNLKEKALEKTYKMILYLEQAPIETTADFMTLNNPNDSNNILIRCYMNKYDLEKLDGGSAQKGIYKSYKLKVGFKKFNSQLNFYEAGCGLFND